MSESFCFGLWVCKCRAIQQFGEVTLQVETCVVYLILDIFKKFKQSRKYRVHSSSLKVYCYRIIYISNNLFRFGALLYSVQGQKTTKNKMSKEEVSTTFTKVLFQCSDCKAHRLPPRTTSAVYNAEDFNKEEAQAVQLKVKTWNFKKAAIELTARNGELFAICPLDNDRFSDSVERTQGSSRYFAIKVARFVLFLQDFNLAIWSTNNQTHNSTVSQERRSIWEYHSKNVLKLLIFSRPYKNGTIKRNMGMCRLRQSQLC